MQYILQSLLIYTAKSQQMGIENNCQLCQRIVTSVTFIGRFLFSYINIRITITTILAIIIMLTILKMIQQSKSTIIRSLTKSGLT